MVILLSACVHCEGSDPCQDNIDIRYIYRSTAYQNTENNNRCDSSFVTGGKSHLLVFNHRTVPELGPNIFYANYNFNNELIC